MSLFWFHLVNFAKKISRKRFPYKDLLKYEKASNLAVSEMGLLVPLNSICDSIQFLKEKKHFKNFR